VLVLYFGWPDIQQWFREDVFKRTPQSAVQLEPPQVQPADADLPLSSKDAAVACGKVLKLDQTAFGKLDLVARLSDLVSKSGFTDEEVTFLGSKKDLEEEAFSAYSLAYLTWEKPNNVSRASLDKMVVDSVQSQDLSTLSPADRAKIDAFVVKLKRMMLNAFDLGRHDAKASPCPF
jgi:hypothetical protein